MAAVSVRDVARRAGVAVGTVSNVLNRPEKVTPATRELVRKAIAELGFVRNDAARQLRNGHSRSVGMITIDGTNPFFAELVTGAEDAANERGLTILNGNSRRDVEREAGYVSLFTEQRTLGILISPAADDSDELFAALERSKTPTVVLERDATGGGLSSVSVNNTAGGRLAVEHLRQQGCRRIMVAAGPLSVRTARERVRGAQAAADVELVYADHDVAGGVALAQQILARPVKERPDAVFAANDLIAIGLLRALLVEGSISVPSELAVIGFDDIDFAAAAAVPLSSVSQPARTMGGTALELLVEQTAARAENNGYEPRHIVFEPELVLRQSSLRRH